MKALTVRQPFAHLIMNGKKTAELRSWMTHHRGPILVHSSMYGFNGKGTMEEAEAIEEGLIKEGETLRFGELLGTVDIVDMERDEDSGIWIWHLANPRPFAKPIEVKGKTMLWEYSGPIPRHKRGGSK